MITFFTSLNYKSENKIIFLEKKPVAQNKFKGNCENMLILQIPIVRIESNGHHFIGIGCNISIIQASMQYSSS